MASGVDFVLPRPAYMTASAVPAAAAARMLGSTNPLLRYITDSAPQRGELAMRGSAPVGLGRQAVVSFLTFHIYFLPLKLAGNVLVLQATLQASMATLQASMAMATLQASGIPLARDTAAALFSSSTTRRAWLVANSGKPGKGNRLHAESRGKHPAVLCCCVVSLLQAVPGSEAGEVERQFL